MITKLTPHQLAQLPEYTRQGVEMGLSVSEPDGHISDTLQKYIPLAYAEAGLSAPGQILEVGSPVAAVRKFYELTGGKLGSPQVFYGQTESSWLSFYRTMHDVVGIAEAAALKPLWKLASVSSAIIFLDEVAIVAHRPLQYHFEQLPPGSDRPARLHNMDGPAILYADGSRINCIAGVRVPDVIVDTPADQLDPALFFQEQNAEVRMAIGAKIGMERLLGRMDHQVLDVLRLGDYEPIAQDMAMRIKLRDQGQPHEEIPAWALRPDGSLNMEAEAYKLVRVDLRPYGGSGAARYLIMGNPSEDKIHAEGVDPICATVRQALAFRAGLTENIYMTPQVVV